MKKSLSLLLLLLPTLLLADMGQALPEQLKDEMTFKEDLEGDSAFVVSDGKMEFDEETESSSFAVSVGDVIKDDKISKTDELSSYSQQPLGSQENTSYFEADDSSRFKEITNQGRTAFSFYYIQDNYDYKSRNDIFDRTFENTTGSVKGGSLLLSVDRYLTKGYVNVSWGANLGFGYNSGKGIFVDGEQSDTTFRLWTLPLEFSLGLEIPVSSWFKISATGGPSVLGVIQNRSDAEDGSAEKERRQVGTGYFAEGKFSINIGNTMRSRMVRLFSEYKMTDIFLDVILRTQQYSNFKDTELEISGTSYGIGLTFDYL